MLGFFITPPPQPALTTQTIIMMVIVLASLVTAQIVGYFLRRQPESTWNPAVIRAFTHRLRAYWMMCAILTASILFPYTATVVLFFLVSFWALREFITLTPTRMGDHRTLFWVFFIFAPLQYFFVYRLQYGVGKYVDWFEVFFIAVPVFCFLFIPARIAIAGDSKRFLERAAKTQAALLICVYSVSYAPALLYLPLKVSVQPPADSSGLPDNTVDAELDTQKIATAEGITAETVTDELETDPATEPVVANLETSELDNERPKTELTSTTVPVATDADESTELDSPAIQSPSPPTRVTRIPWVGNPGVLFFFVVLVQMGDLFQYAWGNFIGKHVIAPDINANRTWEGFAGGIISTAMLGTLLFWATPFGPGGAAMMATVIAVMGFAGTMTMSAIKRDRGVKDYGTLVRGHAGVLDRIDSLCFAAPVFFHLTRAFYT